MQGSILYSIKYDLGGAIDSASLTSAFAALEKEFAGAKPRESDLAVFNLSYLSRAPLKYVISVEQIEIGGAVWELRTEVDPAGLIGFWLRSPLENSKTGATLATRLLARHEAFLDDKNRDYMLYLHQHGETRGRLQGMALPEGRAYVDFGIRVERIIEILSPFLEHRKRYKFHDFRPIFLLDDEAYGSESCCMLLLQLNPIAAGSAARFQDVAQMPSSITGSKGRFLCNTWSFAVREDAWTNELEQMFSHAHSHWFMIHGAIFEIKDIEAFIDEMTDGDRRVDANLLHRFERFLAARKNKMFASIFAAQNSDFITKNAQYRDDLDIFMRDFGIDRQIVILRDFVDRIANLIAEHTNYQALLESRALNRNTKMLEILFLLNTIAGIAAFAPSLYAPDLSNELIFDLPRVLALSLVVFSFLFYFFVIAVGRWLSHRDQNSNQEIDWREFLEN
ncbi:hypothetical protein [Altererythrobacter lutimaris]|uniref:CorA-like Mg2+ transporter protein n=1 Tax=Altererythrobacter lutimaris TaxID=2743979 RepID=A0A850HDQ8_9SPHN|nr:hypothetical protein [Altererythrobacter lutimaris]NVE95780.1 hypothetical protein [Altererythrobacter lutimaris]